MAAAIGNDQSSAPEPARMRIRRISSVAYADEERLSDEKIASAFTLLKRSCARCADAIGAPRTAWRMRRRLAGWSASWRTVPPLPPLESYDLTVVVPCFNHAPFLPYAVDSLVGQELARFRTILVDDHDEQAGKAAT